MSDFVPRDMLPDLWEEILRRHWTFLETEESIQKMEERKQLEVCLKEFLCIVPHDRKFFLPETAQVLKKSVCEMEDFNAYKALLGFESISQYANNLFTKPWRKEFRLLKLYSGFFQHEIKSNLLDAEKLFEAMGYKKLSDEIMVLDGPICPDQVTNISRDAMAAYVECQIMQNVYIGLAKMGATCSWQDIFYYREKHVGGTTQTIAGLTQTIRERRLRREREKALNLGYATIQHAASPMSAQCENCAPYHMAKTQYANPPCALHSGHNGCGIHGVPRSQMNLIYGGGQHPHMPHSRSLEHYNERPAPVQQRSSFDHPQRCAGSYYPQSSHTQPQNVYEAPYDCMDGASVASSASYAAVASTNYNPRAAYEHPYNVSGNRYPLPHNISSQLSSHYATPATVTCNGIKGEHYANLENDYATVAKPHNCNHRTQSPLPPVRHSSALPKDFQSYRQHSFPPDQLIDFDDRELLTNHDYVAQMHAALQKHSFDYAGDRTYDQRHERRVARENAVYAQPQEVCHRIHPAHDPSHLYSRPVQRQNREPKAALNSNEKHFVRDYGDNDNKLAMDLMERTALINGLDPHRRKPPVYSSERDTSDMSCEFEDFVNVGHSEHPQRSPTQAVKNQDGVGSFESWNYVFKNLERPGYAKEVDDSEDLLMKSLDLDAINLDNNAASSTEKRRTNPKESTAVWPLKPEKAKTLEKNLQADKREEASKINTKQEKSILKPQTTNGGVKKKPKSALKATPTIIKIPSGDHENTAPATRQPTESKLKPRAGGGARAKPVKQPLPVSTQVIVSSPNEWSCHFCTFLNPDTKRICEMCARSKDFINPAVQNTPTCV